MAALINDIEIPATASKAPSPEIDRAIRNGKLPVGNTVPRLFLCGHCQKRRIAEGQGICRHCQVMLEDAVLHRSAGINQWAWAIGLAVILSALLIYGFRFVK
jgi:hypothetical protein